MTRRSAALLTAVLLTGSLAACGDDGPDQVSTSSSSTSTSGSTPTASPVETTSPDTSASPESPGATDEPSAPVPAGGTDPVVVEPTGGPLSVTAARVARQDGFDRVVLELDGTSPGEPGWRVEYTDAPSSQGSGDPVDVAGDAVLAVIITGTGYPFDTGVEEVAEDPALPADLEVVQDVVLGAVFEGQYEAFIGLSGERPFTVTRLTDPTRVVIDIAHG